MIEAFPECLFRIVNAVPEKGPYDTSLIILRARQHHGDQGQESLMRESAGMRCQLGRPVGVILQVSTGMSMDVMFGLAASELDQAVHDLLPGMDDPRFELIFFFEL